MKDLVEFEISYTGLGEGSHSYSYIIKRRFFDIFEYDEVLDSEINVDLILQKNPTLLELSFQFSGWLQVRCDTTNEKYKEFINTEFDLVVKYGATFNNENEHLLILPYNENKLNIATIIYESIILAIPFKKTHPGIKDGTLDSEILKILGNYNIDQEKEINTTDPRWDQLKKIN